MARRRFTKSATLVCVAAQAANGLLYGLRWAPDTPVGALLELEFLRLSFMQTIAATATIMPRFEARVARGFNTSDSSGSALVVTGNESKSFTDQETSLVTDLRITNSASAGLTAGAKTKDTQPILELQTNQTITTPNPVVYTAQRSFLEEGRVIVLKKNEGIAIEGPTVIFGAAGQGELNVVIGWSESY